MENNTKPLEIDEQSKAEMVTTAVKDGRNVKKQIAAFASMFGLSTKEVQLALAKDSVEIQREIVNETKKTLRDGFKTGGSLILPDSVKRLSKQLAIKEIMSFDKKALTPVEIENIVKRVSNEQKMAFKNLEAKSLKQIKPTTPGNPGTPPPPAAGGWREKLKSFLPAGPKVTSLLKKAGRSIAIKWFLILGGTLAGAYLIFGQDEVDKVAPTITDDDIRVGNDFKNCILPLVEINGATLGYTSNGDPVVILKNSGVPEWDGLGGLQFYINGRVVSIDGTKRGKWSCKGGSNLTIAESTDKRTFIKNLLLEQSNEMSDNELSNKVGNVIDLLDIPSSYDDMLKAYNILKSVKNRTYNGRPAGRAFLKLYQSSGLGGGDLNKTIDYLIAIEPRTSLLKDKLRQISTQLSGGGSSSNSSRNNKGVEGINIVWDGDKKPVNPVIPGGGGRKRSGGLKYHGCTEFPFKLYCTHSLIADVQECLGIKPDGMFGPVTDKAIRDMGYYGTGPEGVITEEIFNKIKSNCKKGSKIEPVSSIDSKGIVDTGSPVFVTSPNDLLHKYVPVTSEEMLNRTINGVLVSTIINDTVNMTKDGDRYKYKGDLEPDLLEAIDIYFATLGYGRIKTIPKDSYGTKYVWQKQTE